MNTYGIQRNIREFHTDDLDYSGISDSLKSFIGQFFQFIRSYKLFNCKHEHLYNVCLLNKEGVDIKKIMNSYLKEYEQFFRINCSAGYIVLQENGKFRYIYAHQDNYWWFDTAETIQESRDIPKFWEKFQEKFVIKTDPELFKLEDSKSRIILTTNIKFHVIPVHSRAILGNPPLDLKGWASNTSVHCLQRYNGQAYYFDNLCAFRALAAFKELLQNPKYVVRRIPYVKVENLYKEFRNVNDPSLPENPYEYKGAYLHELKSLCRFNKVNVMVFSAKDITREEAEQYENPQLFEFKGKPTANVSRIVYKYLGEFEHTMYLIDLDGHCMLITPGKQNAVLKQFSCRFCAYNTTHSSHLTRHEKTCGNIRKTTYRSGPFSLPDPLNIVGKQLGLPFPEGYEEDPFFITWDVEVSQKETKYVPRSRVNGEAARTVYSTEHRVLCVGVSTNFKHPDIEAVKTIYRQGDSKEDERILIEKMVDYMLKVQKLTSQHLRSVFASYLETLDSRIAAEKEFELNIHKTLSAQGLLQDNEEQNDPVGEENDLVGVEEEEEEENDLVGEENLPAEEPGGVNKAIRMDASPLEKLRTSLLKWIEQIPVIAFNGCKYDINVVREFLFPKLVLLYGEDQVTPITPLKRGCSYMLISTPQFRFLDMRNYVDPSFSLDKFLKAFKAPVGKGVFMYEAIHSVEDLKRDYCPPRHVFDSVLKQTTLSEGDYEELVVKRWTQSNMRTWQDFLDDYQRNDVLPFVTAIENFKAEFKGRDIFHSYVSISGVAYYNLINTAPVNDRFFLPGKTLHTLMKKNMKGGFVSANTRYFKAGESKLRNKTSHLVGGVSQATEDFDAGDGLTVGGVTGKDCNSMYLKETASDMPVGPPIMYVVKHDKLIKKALHGTSLLAKEYLDWIKKNEEGFDDLQTAYDVGEFKIGNRKFTADGFSPSQKTVIQFDGESFIIHMTISLF